MEEPLSEELEKDAELEAAEQHIVNVDAIELLIFAAVLIIGAGWWMLRELP